MTLEEQRKELRSSRSAGEVDPTPQQWAEWIDSLTDEDVAMLYPFIKHPPQAFVELAKLYTP